MNKLRRDTGQSRSNQAYGTRACTRQDRPEHLNASSSQTLARMNQDKISELKARRQKHMVVVAIECVLVAGVVGAARDGEDQDNVLSVAELKEACENLFDQNSDFVGVVFGVCQNRDEAFLCNNIVNFDVLSCSSSVVAAGCPCELGLVIDTDGFFEQICNSEPRECDILDRTLFLEDDGSSSSDRRLRV